MILFPGLIFRITHSPPMQCHIYIGVIEQQKSVDERIARARKRLSATSCALFAPLPMVKLVFLICKFV